MLRTKQFNNQRLGMYLSNPTFQGFTLYRFNNEVYNVRIHLNKRVNN